MNPKSRPRVLLAMGLQSHARQAGIVRYAREAGWVVDSRLVAFHAVGQEREYIQSSAYDGVLALLSLASPWLVPLVRKLRIPVVDMWNDYPREAYPRVLLDHAAAGRMGARHLLERGFRQLLFFTHSIEGKASALRGGAFAKAATEGGATFYELNWDHRNPPRGVKSRIDWLARWLKEAALPLGVMGVNDHVAAEVIDAAEQAGLNIPSQLAVLGADNDSLVTDLVRVPLTSVDTARELAGYEAAALLDELMQGKKSSREVKLIPPTRIVTRRSTEVHAVGDSEVASAIAFIRDRFREPIDVNDVAADRAVSRRHLQDRFLAETGRTIAQSIAQCRLDRAKDLLVSTRLKLSTIAEQSGFSSGERLSKVFRRMMAMTPQQYRERVGEQIATAPPVPSPGTPGEG